MKSLFIFLFLLVSSLSFHSVYAQDSSRVSIFSSLFSRWHRMGQMALQDGSRMYLVANTNDIYVFHVSHPWTPNLYHRFSVADNPTSLEIEGDYMYFTTESEGLAVYYIRWYASAHQVGGIADFGEATSIISNDPYLYVTKANAGLKIIDVSIKEEPRLITSFDLPGEFFVTELIDDFLYVGSDNDSLYIVQVADTNNVNLANTIDMGSEVYDVESCEEKLYVSVAGNGIFVFDLAQPRDPQQQGHYPDLGYPKNIGIIADTIYAACSSGGLEILDATDPSDIRQVGRYTRNIADVYPFENHVIVNQDGEYFTSLNIANPDSIYKIYSYGNAEIRDIEHYGDRILCADLNNGIHPIYVIAPDNPSLGATFPIHEPISVAVFDTFMAVTSYDSYLYLSSTNQLQQNSPIVFSTTGVGLNPDKVEIDENYIYVATESEGFEVFDYSDPWGIERIANYPYAVKGFDLYEDYAVVAKADSSICILNLATLPSQISELGRMDFPDKINDVFYYQNHAFVANNEAGFSIVDISNPNQPVLINTIDTDGQVMDIRIYGFAYVADGENGIRVYDPTNPNDFTEIGYYDTPGFAQDVEPWHDVCGVADTDQIIIVKHEDATNSEKSFARLIPSSFKINSVYPNPFNPSTNISIDVPSAGMLEVAVFNILGQKVATLLNGPAVTGRHNIVFNGSSLSSGTYIVKATYNNREVSTQRIQQMK